MQNVVERNEELRQIESDLGELHVLFKDVATLASMQQEVMSPRGKPPCALADASLCSAVCRIWTRSREP